MPKKRVRGLYRALWLSENEWEEIQEKLKKLGYNDFSKYARKMMLEGQIMIISRYEIEAIRELSIEVSRIGNNINQIARIANSTGKVFKVEAAQMLEQQKEISKLLNQLKDRRNIKVN